MCERHDRLHQVPQPTKTISNIFPDVLGDLPERSSREMNDLVRKFAVSVVLSALLTQASYAQPFPESERQKAEEARKKADEKATDEAYKSLMKRTPNADKKVDPWGGLRAPTTNPGK
jgi:hypothetical protein